MKALPTAALALAALTGCADIPAEPNPHTCASVIPGLNNAEDVSFVDALFAEWVAGHVAPVTRNGFYWTDGNGVQIGWSAAEDAEICVL